MLAEAEAQQVAPQRAQVDEVPLVVKAVLQAVIVQRLCNHYRHSMGRDVSAERAYVRSHVRVGRAEVGQMQVTESVAAGIVWIGLAERVVVQKDRPGPDAHRARGGATAEVGQNVGLLGQAADSGLQLQAPVARGIGLKEDRAAFQKVELAHGIVREDVATVVIGSGQGDTTKTRALGHVVEHGLQSLVPKVGGEGEHGGVDAGMLAGRTCGSR